MLPATSNIPSGPYFSLDRLWTLLLIVCIGSTVNYFAFSDYVFDDAYITLRYSANLAAGNGFVFNPGERILGTTSPFLTLLLAGIGVLGFDLSTGAAIVFCVSLGAIAYLGAHLLGRFGFPNLGLVYATLTVWGIGNVFRFFRLELPLLIVLLLLCVVTALRNQRYLTGLFLALAFLTRYDAALFVVPFFFVLWVADRRPPLRAYAIAGLVVAPWLLFSHFYFGSIFPNTLEAKKFWVSTPEYMYTSLWIQMNSILSPLYSFISNTKVPSTFRVAAICVLFGPILFFAHRLFGRSLILVQLLFYPVLLWLGYSYIAPPPIFSWYITPASYFLILLAFFCWGLAFDRVPLNTNMRPVAILFAITGLVLLPHFARSKARNYLSATVYKAKIEVYENLARWITKADLADLKVFMYEPGYFAYLTGASVVDGWGLVSKDMRPSEDYNLRFQKRDQEIRRRDVELVINNRVFHPSLPSEFIPLYVAAPSGELLIRRDRFAERFDGLSELWLNQAASLFYPEDMSFDAAPFYIDFEPGEYADWSCDAGLMSQFVGRPTTLTVAGQPVPDSYLNTFGPGVAQLSSRPFIVGFDEISFRFYGSGGARTRALLVVDGQVVLSQEGEETEGEMLTVRWPLGSWKGLVAVLQLVDDAIGAPFVAADHFNAQIYSSSTRIDDFETGSYGPVWEMGFGKHPTHLSLIGREHGLGFLVGEYAALSVSQGRAEMLSRPIRISHDNMSLLVFDFGGPETGVRLEVGGEPVYQFHGSRSGRLQPVTWSLARFRGKEARLVVVDHDGRDDERIGIDALMLFDRVPVAEVGDSVRFERPSRSANGN